MERHNTFLSVRKNRFDLIFSLFYRMEAIMRFTRLDGHIEKLTHSEANKLTNSILSNRLRYTNKYVLLYGYKRID